MNMSISFPLRQAAVMTARAKTGLLSDWVRSILLFSMGLAYGGLFWMHILHERRGMQEAHEIAPALHWLRDASLAFPAVLVAVIAGMSLWRKYNERLLPARLGKPMLAVILAVATTMVFILGVPLHAALFGGDHTREAAVYAPRPRLSGQKSRPP